MSTSRVAHINRDRRPYTRPRTPGLGSRIYLIVSYVPYILDQRVILTIYRLSMLYIDRFPLYFRYIIFLFLGTIKINSWSLLHLQGLLWPLHLTVCFWSSNPLKQSTFYLFLPKLPPYHSYWLIDNHCHIWSRLRIRFSLLVCASL